MRCLPALALVLVGVAPTAAAQPQSTLHCYGIETQIGVVARRDFVDDRGFVVKEILYRSTETTGQRTCAEDTLRIYSIRTITRDALGRSVVETELAANGTVERVVRYEYVGDSKEPSRDIWSAPDGTRRYEVRRARGSVSHLYYDDHGLVVGVTGALPKDVVYALHWGTEVDGWSCGIAVANASVYVHFKNGTQKETPVLFVDSFDTDLRSASSGPVALLPAFRASRGASSKRNGIIMRLVAPREAAFYTYSLEPRYGRLAPGRYSLAVWYPHPVTGVKVLSNRIEFEITSQ